jgi:hypothetical protein
MDNLYDTDTIAWAEQQVALLRNGRFSEIDVLNIIEEIEDVAKRERRELSSRLSVLIAHLLKWQVQPGLRCRSWRSTIRVQRKAIGKLLRLEPGLKPSLEDLNLLERAWLDALVTAIRETGVDELPELPIWSTKQLLDPDFLPD